MQNNPTDQHTVSQVVLRKFNSPIDKKLMAFDRSTMRLNRRSPSSSFFVPDFVVHQPVATEELWGAVETKMPRAYAAIERRTALTDLVATKTLKDLLAMHWVRSPATQVVSEHARKSVLEDSKVQMAKRPEVLARLFQQRTGFAPAGPESLAWVNEDLHSGSGDLFGRAWTETLHRNFQAARDHFEPYELQIVHSDQWDFMISDVPVITSRAGHNGLAVHQEVALNEATDIYMPISPNVMISLAPNAAEGWLTPAQARSLNEQQVQTSIRWVGWQPDGAIDRQWQAFAARHPELAG